MYFVQLHLAPKTHKTPSNMFGYFIIMLNE